LRVTVRAKRARAAGCPQRFARCVAMWCDAQRRVVERCDAPRRVALPTVMSISPTRLIDYAKTWRGRKATSRQRCCRIVFMFVSDSMRSPCIGLVLAEWLCRTADRDLSGASVWTTTSLSRMREICPESNFLCCLLQLCQNASVVAQGCADFSSDSTDRNHSFTPDPRWASPSLRPGLIFSVHTGQEAATGSHDTFRTSSVCCSMSDHWVKSDHIIVANSRGQHTLQKENSLGLEKTIGATKGI
jgi:hypothetical protein